MDSFPFLLVLFLVTAVAFLAYGARTYKKADKALEDDKPEDSVRMAVPESERSPVGPLISDMVAERDGKG